MASEDVQVTGKELAVLIGCRPSYIVELKKKGRLVSAEDGKGYLRDASLALYAQTQDPAYSAVAARHAQARGSSLAGAGEGADAEGDDLDADGDSADSADSGEGGEGPAAPATPDAKRKAKALADKAEIDAKAAARDYEVSMGKLLDAAQVEHELAEAATAIRVELERMADTLAPQLAATSDEARCRELIWNEVSHALEEMSRGFRVAASAVAE
ncbi:hypothetical protein [Stenotrophomonas oahuensis]|uniref:Terminase small subunit n=1 Tax=Stenotrophomonas oahuensis TaxID=3003271 RepID=A0ABY9YQR9_9GAMM|nr:hypothetical protein [Stenotrophomonas sp. A5586]WNH52805.1 hypothetical protein PDM29_00610 [Stenotrophomonas sp. A5586]